MTKPTRFCALYLLLTLLVLSGCATLDSPLLREEAGFKLAPPQEGFALVYISRPSHGFAKSVWPDVYFNDTEVVALKDGGFSYVYARPGDYRVVARKAQWYAAGWGERTKLTIAPDRTYFLFLNVLDKKNAQGEERSWELIDRDTALRQLSQQKYIEPVVL